MKHIKYFVIMYLTFFIFSCSGKGAEVGAVVATAATLKVVQTAREKKQSRPLNNSKGDCCIVCNECTFPCGNSCVSNGTLCTRPKGCACTADESIPEGTPRPEPNPIDCQSTNVHPIAL